MRRGWGVLLAGIALAGCAGKTERIVLLPSPDGKVGKVVVQKGDAEVTLNSAYASAEVRGKKVEEKPLTEKEVQARYASTLSAQPARPRGYTVYFVLNQTRLTPESLRHLDEIKREIATLPAPEVVVTGHTDRIGGLEYNDALSLKRAETVRDILVSIGIPRERIEIAGRGERDPLIPTEDNVAEPRNRRVEIKIR